MTPIAAEIARGTADKPLLYEFEKKVEDRYTQELLHHCQKGMRSKEMRKQDEMGIFGIGTDWAKVKKIEEERIPSCDELKKLGFK